MMKKPSQNFTLLPFEAEESLSETEMIKPLLPRSSWQSNVAYLRALFKAKKALDRIEKEAMIVRNKNS